jgi:dipeptidyl-peptidase-4
MKLNKLLFSLFCFVFNSVLFGQNKITLDDIWKNNAFGSKVVSGIKSMKDGEHYTTLNANGSEQFIIKYSYKTGSPVDTIFKTSQAKNNQKEIPKIESYQFSEFLFDYF